MMHCPKKQQEWGMTQHDTTSLAFHCQRLPPDPCDPCDPCALKDDQASSLEWRYQACRPTVRGPPARSKRLATGRGSHWSYANLGGDVCSRTCVAQRKGFLRNHRRDQRDHQQHHPGIKDKRKRIFIRMFHQLALYCNHQHHAPAKAESGL